jgi:hypothetical protein
MEAATAPNGLPNVPSSWRNLRITHVIQPVKELQSNGMSKETRCVFGYGANNRIFYQIRS